jgi:hypothetical protein
VETGKGALETPQLDKASSPDPGVRHDDGVGDPAGYAVDWDWQCGLTVRELAGRRSEPRFNRKVLEYELPASPDGERQGAGRGAPLVAGAGPRSGDPRGERERQAPGS